MSFLPGPPRADGSFAEQVIDNSAIVRDCRTRHHLRVAPATLSPDRDRDVPKSRKTWTPGGATMVTDIDTFYTRRSSQRDDLAKLSRYEGEH